MGHISQSLVAQGSRQHLGTRIAPHHKDGGTPGHKDRAPPPWTSWYKHVKKFCGEFKDYKKQNDVCDICLHYDNKILPGFRQIADHVRSLVTPSLPTYWDKFDAEWDATKANAVSNPQYLSALLKYSESHRHRRRRNESNM